MIQYIHSTTLLVADQDAALDFYVGKLGWEKRADSSFSAQEGVESRWIEVGPSGAETVLALLRPEDVGASAEAAGSEQGVSLVTDDIEGTYKELAGREVRFDGEPQEMPWGQKATWFYDPDGNRFFLVEE
ncbi:MAG: VOC family protein [Rubrobacteraceae bacterium]